MNSLMPKRRRVMHCVRTGFTEKNSLGVLRFNRSHYDAILNTNLDTFGTDKGD